MKAGDTRTLTSNSKSSYPSSCPGKLRRARPRYGYFLPSDSRKCMVTVFQTMSGTKRKVVDYDIVTDPMSIFGRVWLRRLTHHDVRNFFDCGSWLINRIAPFQQHHRLQAILCIIDFPNVNRTYSFLIDGPIDPAGRNVSVVYFPHDLHAVSGRIPAILRTPLSPYLHSLPTNNRFSKRRVIWLHPTQPRRPLKMLTVQVN